MARFCLKTQLFAGALTLVAAQGMAADASGGADLCSAYVWRGLTFNDGPVVQPWLDVSGIKIARGVSLGVNVWTSVDLDDYNGLRKSGEVWEADFTFTLTLPKGFKAGYIEYTFPTGLAEQLTMGSRELFAGWSGTKGLTLTANAYYDVDEAEDFFATVALGRSAKMSEKASLNLEAQVGLAGEKFARVYGGTDGGLYHYAITSKLSYKASEKATLAATAGYTGNFNEKVLPKQDASFYAGLGVSVGF
jgi:hypothetical protein